MLSQEDQIWNRATLGPSDSGPGEGDFALASLLHAHGLAMNGGVVHALETMTQAEVLAAIAGFRYFGLSVAAGVLSQAPDGSEAAEKRLDLMYWQAVPDDSTLVRAFQLRLSAFPEAFAPVVSGVPNDSFKGNTS